jgi:RpiR family transcriptional regulator, glv operon transcriptional regulator
MKIEQLINERYSTFSEGDIVLAKYILNNKESIHKLTIYQLASNSLTSKSSVLRFAQKLGFSGYSEMKNFMKWGNFFSENAMKYTEFGDCIGQSINNTINYLKKVDLSDIHTAIEESQHIYLVGTGIAQQNQVAEMQRIFLGIGKEMQILPIGMNTTLYQILIERMTEKDLLIVFSSSGNNPILQEALSTPILKNVKILGITSHDNNWLVNHSTYSIQAHIEPIDSFSDLFRLYSPFHVIIEILAYSYIEYKNAK